MTMTPDQYRNGLATLGRAADAELARDIEQLGKVKVIVEGQIKKGGLPSSQQATRVQKLNTIEDITTAMKELSSKVGAVNLILTHPDTDTSEPTHS